MKKNMGSIDKIIRIVVALLIIVLFFAKILSGTVAIILLVISLIFILTSIVGFCPLYRIFGLTTCKTKATNNE
ncbi:DUF2892 domain-containing protein [Bacteroidetes/Chlorobi group bacterium ChocPot_Mid]|jgi:hypothetical protein|nr:MAG: DUF2892 domain-containing protein [Bacteroidetes/Chlorobi group bacterium ChocPot_Mid]